VFEKVSQSNSRFIAVDRTVITVHSIRMPSVLVSMYL